MSDDTSSWLDQCPARGPGLTHVRSSRCADEHDPMRHGARICCECEREPHRHDFSAVTGRCRACGEAQFPDADEEDMDLELRQAGVPPTMAPSHLLDPESVPLEPKMATGRAGGRAWGPGRSWWGDGQLSPRDRVRLGFVARSVAKLEDGGS